MKSEKNKSVGLLIRRFIAGLIFLSVISELIEDISTGNFSGRSLDDLFFGLIIVFFLAFSSRKNKTPNTDPVLFQRIEERENKILTKFNNLKIDDEVLRIAKSDN